MRKVLLAGLAGLLLAGPVLAQDRPGYRQDAREFRDDRRDYREDRREFRDDRRDFRDDRREFRDNRRDFRGIRGDYRDDRRDWGRRDFRWNGSRYRGPVYVHPRGYGYRNWNIGYRLPPAYIGNRYFIGNPGFYRLPPAFRGTRWVRVGPDALLISVFDGVVVQAVRGLYW